MILNKELKKYDKKYIQYCKMNEKNTLSTYTPTLLSNIYNNELKKINIE